jgi:hypothetical protein
MVRTESNKRKSVPAPKASTIAKSDEHYASEHLFIKTLVTRNHDSFDFHDAGVASVTSMLNAVSRDANGRELSKEELDEIIHNNLWNAADDYDDLQVQNWDTQDFHEVSVWGIKNAINDVKKLR